MVLYATLWADRPSIAVGVGLVTVIIWTLAIYDWTTDSGVYRRWLVRQLLAGDATGRLQFCRPLLAPALLATLILVFRWGAWSAFDQVLVAVAVFCTAMAAAVVALGVPGWMKPRWFRREEAENFPVLASTSVETRPMWIRLGLIGGFLGLGVMLALARSPGAAFFAAAGVLSAFVNRGRLDPWSDEGSRK